MCQAVSVILETNGEKVYIPCSQTDEGYCYYHAKMLCGDITPGDRAIIEAKEVIEVRGENGRVLWQA